jgi:acetyltransferase EpsM
MTAPFPVLIPLVNPNEAEALIAALHVREGQLLQPGDLIAELETTKSNAELLAEQGGFVRNLRATEGQTLRAGEILCYLTCKPDDPLPVEATPAQAAPLVEDGRRISAPARQLAIDLKVDLGQFPSGLFITREMVQAAAANSAALSELQIEPLDILVYGGGGHGKSLIELIRAAGIHRVIGVIDDGLPVGSQILGVPVLGGGSVLIALQQRGLKLAVNAVGGIGNIAPRLKVFEKLAAAGFTCPTVIHPTAFIEASAVLAEGVQVMPFAYIGSSAQIGFGCIINTRATVSHDCWLAETVNLAPGSILAGGVQVGARTLIGMNATLNLEVKIGAGVRIGNGATVKSDVADNEVVRAGSIWPVKN